MAGRLRTMALYLGLVDDDEQDEYYDEGYDDPRADARDVELTTSPVSPRQQAHAPVAPIGRRVPAPAAVRDEPRYAPVAPTSDYRITTLQPRTYNEARTIGEHFREGVPVIINLTEMDDADAKRLVDFAAGLIFGLHGSIERVTAKVFLLSPSNVEVSAEDKARLVQSGFFNQS
jgi:cell division inhibitor SepF